MNLPARRKPLALLFCYGFAGVLTGTYAVEALAQASAPLRVDPVLLGLPAIKPAEAPKPAPAAAPVPAPEETARAEIKPVEAAVVENAVEKPPEPVAETPAAAQVDEDEKALELRKRAKAAGKPVPPAPETRPPATSAPAEAQAKPLTPPPAPTPSAVVLPVQPAAETTRREAQSSSKTIVPERQLAKEPAAPVAVPASAVPNQATKPVAQASAQATAPSAIRPVAPSSAATSTASSSGLAPLRVNPALLGQPPAPAIATSAPPSTTTSVPSSASPANGAVSEQPAPLVVASNNRTSTRRTLATRTPASDKSWLSSLWSPVANAYDNGAWEFYLPLKTHHLRSAYTSENIASYQENPLGLGIGRGGYNENGNWEGVYAMAFQDSHSKPMYTAGYGWKAIWRPTEDTRLGLGYTAGLMSRTDIFHYIPFPALLPVASVAYKNFSLEGTFVPGGKGNGNIFFIWAKWELGKPGEVIGTPARPVAPEPTGSTELANTAFGESTPLASQRVPYGPAIDADSRLADASQTIPPQVPATGERDEDEVPDPSPALALGSSKALQSLAVDSSEPRPTFLSAQRMGGVVDREFIAEGDAELRKIGTVLEADRLTYWPLDDEVEAEGRVRLEQGDDVLSGPKMRLKLEEQVGFFEQPSYVIKRQPKEVADNGMAERFSAQQSESSWLSSGFAAPRVVDAKPVRATTEGHGDADRIDFEGKNQFRLTNSTYTTCKPGNDDWYAKTSELKLDYDREVGEGTDATIYFKDVPILYSPWLSFSLNDQRKSGFLAPSFGTSSDNGVELSLPYYWNIAPNMDATITPRVISKRGVMINNEFRYLNTAFGGQYRDQARIEFLPNDQLNDGKNRYGFSLLHTQTTDNGFSGQINYNKVSDDDYYTDLSSGIASTSTTQLLQQGVLSYSGGGWWNATANFQQYQTLQPDPENPVREPYKMLPQITVNARKPDLYMTDSSFLGQYTHFTRADQYTGTINEEGDSGRRTVLYPQVAFPYLTPGWYVTPKVGLNSRHYSLSGRDAGIPGSISSTLPIFSVDSGMTFERQSNWFGRDYTQTLEPRLYYLNIPYKDQSEIPRFDTELADFNFAQIFSENQFSGWDRINNANQLTMAMTSRLLEPSTGNEILRAMLGQRLYFSPNKVGLDSTIDTTNKWDKSDVLAAFSGQILPKVYADFAWQYNLTDRQVKRYSMGAHYRPEPGKVLNANYRYYRDTKAPLNQVDFSGQWPISGRWHAVGRLNYSFKDDATNFSSSSKGGRMIESIAGLEYNAGCWAVRGVVQRTALTEDKSSTAFYIQLELTDFGQIGSNPLNLLKRNIQGYSQINQTGSETGFDE